MIIIEALKANACLFGKFSIAQFLSTCKCAIQSMIRKYDVTIKLKDEKKLSIF